MRCQGYSPSMFGRGSNAFARLSRHPRTPLAVTNIYICKMVELGFNATKREISTVEEHGFMRGQIGVDFLFDCYGRAGRMVTHYLKGLLVAADFFFVGQSPLWQREYF